MVANKERGDVALDLDGTEYTLRPTFEALCIIEGRLDSGILEIAERLATHRIGLREVTTVIFETAKAGGHKVDEGEIGEAVLRVGLLTVVAPILNLLRRALAGPSEGNLEAPSAEATK